MTDTTINPFDAPLDEFEQEIEDSIHLVSSVPDVENEKKKLAQAAKNTLKKMRERKELTIAPLANDIQKIEAMAQDLGIPYEELISSLIHQLAMGNIKLEFSQRSEVVSG